MNSSGIPRESRKAVIRPVSASLWQAEHLQGPKPAFWPLQEVEAILDVAERSMRATVGELHLRAKVRTYIHTHIHTYTHIHTRTPPHTHTHPHTHTPPTQVLRKERAVGVYPGGSEMASKVPGRYLTMFTYMSYVICHTRTGLLSIV
jgi:hypothetical protein